MNSSRFESGNESINHGSDWFTENPPQQPKTEIADYIQSENLPNLKFPKRYSILEGIKCSATKPIIFRTEHPDEYTGASGVGESVIFGPDDTIVDEADLFNRLEKVNKNTNSNSESSPITYSAWEVIPGINKTIYRDDIVPGKFHIFLRWKDAETEADCAHYMQIEEGKLIFKSGDDIDETHISNNIALTTIYNDICSLEKFSDTHSAIMEFQESTSTSDPGQHYFLQTHRGREQTSVNFELDIPEGYIEIKDVRGATGSAGIAVDMLLASVLSRTPKELEPRSSYFGIDYLQRNQDPRKASVIITKTSLHSIASNHKYSHFNVDILTKPQLVLFPETKINLIPQLLTPEAEKAIYEYELNYLETEKGRLRLIDYSTNVHVISDGRKACMSMPSTLIVRFFDAATNTPVTLEVQPDGSSVRQ